MAVLRRWGGLVWGASIMGAVFLIIRLNSSSRKVRLKARPPPNLSRAPLIARLLPPAVAHLISLTSISPSRRRSRKSLEETEKSARAQAWSGLQP